MLGQMGICLPACRGARLIGGWISILQVADKMGSPAQQFAQSPESHQEIQRSCRKAKQSYHDPTIVHRLNLQVAIAEERYDDACM